MGPCPMSFYLMFVVILSDHKKTVIGDSAYKNEDNIGTVLFEKGDCGKHCWSSEELAILNSRRMFQDILPKANVINYQNDQYIALLMDYFHICLECVRKLSIGKTKHLMLRALADTMGGYLKVYILPFTKHSFYAGNIKYRNAKRLFELFDELKIFLHTNGDGWRSPRNPPPNHIKIPPLVVIPSKSPDACDGLITYSSPVEESNVRNHPLDNYKKKRLAHHRHRAKRRLATGGDPLQYSGSVTVPLPFLDDNQNPNSIAVPFKKNNLQSLHGENAAFSLVKYYIASVKCIGTQSRTKNQLEKFNSDLYEWLRKSFAITYNLMHRDEDTMLYLAASQLSTLMVTPHLQDDKWYPAFGGVLRVMAALKESGYGNGNNRNNTGGGEYQVIPQFNTDTIANQPADPGIPPLYNSGGRGSNNSASFGTTELIVVALVSGLLVWLFVGLMLVCYRFLKRNSEDYGPSDSPKSPSIAVLYENGDFCAEACPSKIMHKSIREKLKEWWKNKFRRCPGGCDRYEDDERCLASMSYTSKDTVPGSSSSKIAQKRQYKKSVSRSTSPRERKSSKKVCYSSDEYTTTSDSPMQ